ncbi:GNAT family N-acetyltransferase [Chryseobacterium sp. POL2]|uniref:GNAT family N-acetyltransferase n=1 Tax=Chryseobacterium sp. POL2 TaxID=2713414 RepID=UPI0013E17DD4|nr:GNAT family N-acetyltransferase [Chryseobacterium sp. POL2]QIG89045.1 N-acetyltransferase [Chryseobacterium sp. POL2]
MEIRQQNNEKNGMFEAFIDDRHAGEMTYTWAGTDKFIIDHTGVEESYNGMGVGKNLLLAVVDYARANHIKVIPLCPFAKATFNKNPNLQDVLA